MCSDIGIVKMVLAGELVIELELDFIFFVDGKWNGRPCGVFGRFGSLW